MWEQPKGKAFAESGFFADGQVGRPAPQGTVARGHLEPVPGFYTGQGPQGLLESVPIAVNLARGKEVYQVFCAVCHGAQGAGNGPAVARGFPQPASFTSERLRAAPPGYFFLAATQGFGRMMGYASRISPEDRWAAVAYIKECIQKNNCPGGSHAAGSP